VSFSIQRSGASVVVTVERKLVVETRQEFKRKVVEEIETGGRLFRFDFGTCEYLDASGFGVLVSLRKKIAEVGGELTIRGLNEDLATLFHLTGFDRTFVIIESAAPAGPEYARVDGRSAR
jgi:anti-sigma B factor antagonist